VRDPNDFSESCLMLGVRYNRRNPRKSAIELIDKLDRATDEELAQLCAKSGMRPLEFFVRVTALRTLGAELLARVNGN